MPNGKNVATKKKNEVATIDIEKFADQGFENIDSKSLQLPFLKILGQLSPQVTAGDSKYIEARLYQTDADATSEGKIYADSITGPEAIVSGSSVMWKEKARDRRKCVPKAGLTEAGCQQVARYGGFIISGNLVLLCEGLDTIESHELCMNLIKQLNE